MAAASPGKLIGCDFAGTVADPNGSHWRDGQRVAGFVQAIDTGRGAYAEYVVVEASLVFPIPEGISYQEAAVIPLAFATAVQAMFQRLSLPEPSKPSKSPNPFLVSGGASSVGKYAIQLGKLAGLFVIATGSPKNHALLKDLGADACVDYNDPNWPEQVREISNNQLENAFDCIVENGTVLNVAKAISSTKGGHIVTILPIVKEKPKIAEINNKIKIESTLVYTVFQKTLNYGFFDNQGEETPEDKAFWEKYASLVPEYLTSGKIKPNRIREFGGLDDVLAGFKEQKEGKVRAEKLVYKIAADDGKP